VLGRPVPDPKRVHGALARNAAGQKRNGSVVNAKLVAR